MSLILIVLLPFIGSLLAACMPSNARNAEAWLAGGVAVVCAALVISLQSQVADGGVVRHALPWIAGLDFSLRLDGYAWLFALLVAVMGGLVVLYARYYMSPDDPVPRFFSFFLAFMGSMLGVVLSGNLIQLVMFWELTSLASFMLIAYWNHRIDARRGARMALIVTATGGLCLLAGVLMLGQVVGSYDLDRVLVAGDRVRAHAWYPVILALIALGALTKSAQFPFHFWLPHAMAAPTPVSAYLHSATMVKAGVFLLARFWPVLSGSEEWFWLIGGAGLCSLVLGAYAAMFQRDMKGVLAYSTISHLGLITLLLGMNSPLALVAAVFHIVNHATFKASLFMAAGIVDHETGTRDLTRLSGLARAMPITATLAMVAAASMAGVPLLNGFLSKEMFFAETVFTAHSGWLPVAAVIAGIFSVAYSLRFILQVFYGPAPHDLPRAPHEPPRWMLVPSALLVLACLLVGILPGLTVGPFLDNAAQAILGVDKPAYSLAIWHGFNLPLLMSLVALIGGVLLYLWLQWRQASGGILIYRFDGKRAFEFVMATSMSAADHLMRYVSSRRLQVQLLLLVCAAFIAALIPLWPHGFRFGNKPLAPLDPVFALLWLSGAACAVGAAHQAKYHRLVALILAGGAGLATCLTFAWFSAPDLALTQITVEVVTVVLILLGLRWLPRRIEQPGQAGAGSVIAYSRRLRDFGIAALVGCGMAGLTFAVMSRTAIEGIAPFFIRESLPQGGGLNVVNVILVDFRGFDTLGEITVLGIVALTVYALLRRFRPAPESVAPPQQQLDQPMMAAPNPDAALPAGYLMVPTVLVRLIMPVAALVSLYFLLRGHNAPGGGFVGGLILSTAVILQYMFGGIVWVESRSRLHPQYWIAIGLLAAGSAGIGSWFAARPFLTSLAGDLHLPLIGAVHLSSVLPFDIGVYMLVVGATTLVLVALAHQSLRTQHRKPLPTQQERQAD